MNRSLHEMGVKYDPQFKPPKPVKRMRPQRNVGSEVLPTKRKKVVPVEEVGSSSKSSQSETVKPSIVGQRTSAQSQIINLWLFIKGQVKLKLIEREPFLKVSIL